MKVIVDRQNMRGYPNGLNCRAETGKCYTVMSTLILPLLMAVPFRSWTPRIVAANILADAATLIGRTHPLTKLDDGGGLEFDPENETFFVTFSTPHWPRHSNANVGVTVQCTETYCTWDHDTNDFIGFVRLFGLVQQLVQSFANGTCQYKIAGKKLMRFCWNCISVMVHCR